MFSFVSKLIEITINIRLTLDQGKVCNSSNILDQMSNKQISLLNVITKQIVLEFCQIIIYIYYLFWTVLELTNYQEYGKKETNAIIVMQLAFCIFCFLWCFSLCLSFAFLSKYYAFCCDKIHQSCLNCFIKHAAVRAINRAPIAVPLMTANE